ncbi:hypothetical protein KIM372_03810 [Bombiscardovia nodaiensis]|uniref:Uncharacterized protein n=1 Tax=Bombiscardovia nodaiensis TaxID=2932181 RepID=A0ABN6S8E4_9BIFI|nr:hypothetical protein KIM372_03810 [Bombiscardovia nodaiensis]
MSSCESAEQRVQEASQLASDPAAMQTLALKSSAQAWLQVAISCPTRFGEATTRSGLSWYTAQQRARQTPSDSVNLPDPQELGAQAAQALETTVHAFSPTQAAHAAQCEDAAGFSMTLIAARRTSNSNALLKAGDLHHAAAQQFAAAADKDPRQGVYSAQPLLDHPDTMADHANGLQAPTEAVVEANCARALLTVNEESPTATAEPQSSNMNTPDTKDEHSSKAGTTQTAPNRPQQTLAMLTTARWYSAFSLGYPSFDQALFRTPADD